MDLQLQPRKPTFSRIQNTDTNTGRFKQEVNLLAETQRCPGYTRFIFTIVDAYNCITNACFIARFLSAWTVTPLLGLTRAGVIPNVKASCGPRPTLSHDYSHYDLNSCALQHIWPFWFWIFSRHMWLGSKKGQFVNFAELMNMVQNIDHSETIVQ